MYEESTFITVEHVYGLIQESNDQCYYCSCHLQFVNYAADMGTIERLDNSFGHIIGNCVIACRTCNLSKVGSKRKRE